MSCKVEGCDGRHEAHGLCARHYQRWKRLGTTELPERPSRCKAKGCDRRPKAKGLCPLHYKRLKTAGTTADPVRLRHTCIVVGCESIAVARGMCTVHHDQWRYRQGYKIKYQPIPLEKLQRHAVTFRPYAFDPCEAHRAQSLWTCVILQAVRDATAPDPDAFNIDQRRRREAARHKNETRVWLFWPNEDFAYVCALAGLDPSWVREGARRYVANKDRIQRLIAGFHGHYRGYLQTFDRSEGTGGGSRKTHFEAEAGA